MLREKHAGDYNDIRRAVRRIAPFFDDFVLVPSRDNERMIRLEWKQVGLDGYFDVSSFSDGTLRFIAMATLLLQPAELLPSVIVVDEPESGLHPYAVDLLAGIVKSISSRSQVILATQSSLLLDRFEPEDVIVADRVDGSTRLTRLEPKELEDWLKEYTLGQLWEKNDIGGCPAPERLRMRCPDDPVAGTR